LWEVLYSAVVFFFQAEDGIRDKLVTGVQTCALPICIRQPQIVFGDDAGIGEALGRDPHVVALVGPLNVNVALTMLRRSSDRQLKIGRASCRERGSMAVGAESFGKKE